MKKLILSTWTSDFQFWHVVFPLDFGVGWTCISDFCKDELEINIYFLKDVGFFAHKKAKKMQSNAYFIIFFIKRQG